MKALLSELAKDFARFRLVKADGVVGVLLVGSSSIGCADGSSDIDLEVFVTKESYNSMRKAYGGYDSYRGKDISWEWMTIEELEDALKDWKDDVDLWVYSKSTILFDLDGQLAMLLGKYKRYPKRVWLKKLFLYWYFATANAPYDSGKAIQRDDLITAQLCLTQAMEYYTSLIFILNKSFVPYRKWRLQELEKLRYKPKDYAEVLSRILTTVRWTKQEFEAKQSIINNLVSELEKKLFDSGIKKEKLENPWKIKVTDVPKI
jgi:predicted nucleotidyltransferase